MISILVKTFPTTAQTGRRKRNLKSLPPKRCKCLLDWTLSAGTGESWDADFSRNRHSPQLPSAVGPQSNFRWPGRATGGRVHQRKMSVWSEPALLDPSGRSWVRLPVFRVDFAGKRRCNLQLFVYFRGALFLRTARDRVPFSPATVQYACQGFAEQRSRYEGRCRMSLFLQSNLGELRFARPVSRFESHADTSEFADPGPGEDTPKPRWRFRIPSLSSCCWSMATPPIRRCEPVFSAFRKDL